MKGTIYGNRLPRGTQVKKGWAPLCCGIAPHDVSLQSSTQKTQGLQKPSVPYTMGRLNKLAGISAYGHSSGECNGWSVSRQEPLDATIQNILNQASYNHLITRSQQTVLQAKGWANEKSLFDSRQGRDIRLYSKCPDRVRKAQSFRVDVVKWQG